MANFLVLWKPYGKSKTYRAVMSSKNIREWAQDYATHQAQFLKTGANVRECIKFLNSHYQYVIATPFRGAVRIFNLGVPELIGSETISQTTLELELETTNTTNPWEK